ncbi:hypothetical protein [Pseudomonas sp. BN411]|uniref:hypothetical protein n=1 Tax=Pseudomonas sp. BN411 TaxID=2567887 RepID=UPI0024581CF7|nr:hypothetical protein [Pseudomonas sp. BN411]MDH4564006.1 hypothetical protein [Pseudomonas sp. BN411]
MKYDLNQMLEDIRRDEPPEPSSPDRNILSQDEIRKLAASRRRRGRAAAATLEAAPEQEKNERDS